MAILADLVMMAWIPVVLLLFAVLPPRRAVIVAFLAGFLFLPMVSYKLPYLPDYSKMSATSAGILFGSLCFDSKRFFAFRPQLIDLPAAIVCAIPLASSLVNGLGAWDGISAALTNTVTWGMPYLIGRMYFTDLSSLKELAFGIVIGGLVYIPFCVFEMRMSPQLHSIVYGIDYRWGGTRFGGWRPAVFLDTGLQLGMWMSISAVTGLWLWWTGEFRRLAGVSATFLVWALAITTVLCRSTGALALAIIGLGAIWISQATGTRIALWALLLTTPAYIGLRTTGLWHCGEITALAELLNAERAQSFQFRIENEDMLIQKAMQQPIVGWGGWGRSRVYDEWGKDLSITDGLWVIVLGTNGLVGVIALYTIFCLPLGLLLFKTSFRQLTAPGASSVLVLAVAVSLFAIDCLLNAMPNPVFVLVSGAVVSVATLKNPLRSVASTSIADASERRTRVSRRLHPHCK